MSRQEPSSLDFISPVNPDWMHLQLNDYDFYTTRPSSLDTAHGNSLPMNQYSSVPVIRIYGCLPSGHQAVCHVHGIFPYIFIGYDGKKQDSSTDMNHRCAKLHRLLESKCQEFAGKNEKVPSGQPLGALSYIANVSVVKAVPFYGFHVGWSLFYKISLLNPGLVNKFSDWIRDGKMFGKRVESYETHLPYLLQFSVDFNLFGCSWMDFNQCYFREPLLNPILSLDVLLMNQDLKTILRRFYHPNSNALCKKDFPRMGNGLLEIDIIPQYIRNIDNLQFTGESHDSSGTSREELSKPYVTSTKNIVRDISMQRKAMSLEPFKDPPSLERYDINDHWQSSDSFASAFKNFTQKLNQNPKNEHFGDDSSLFTHVNKPHELLSELWPSRPTAIPSAVTESNNEVEDGLIDTLENDYVIVNSSDTENDDKGLEENDSPLAEEYQQNHSTVPVPDGEVPAPGGEIPPLSMDVAMTQKMAKKRKFTFTQTATHSNVKVQKRKPKKIGIRYERNAYRFKNPPVDYSSTLPGLEDLGFPKQDYIDPFFGDPKDLKSKPYVYAGKRFEIGSTHLSCRIPMTFEEENIVEGKVRSGNVFHSWKYLRRPPEFQTVKHETESMRRTKSFISQIERSSFQRKAIIREKNNAPEEKSSIFSPNTLTHFSMEIHVETEGSKKPDPVRNEVKMVVWCLEKESFPFDLDISHEGILAVVDQTAEPHLANHIVQGAGDVPVAFYKTEMDMFDALTDLVLFFDTDILSGFEIHDGSWGYIIERCRKHYGIEISEDFSRVNSNLKNKARDRWGFTHASGIMIAGRHMINVWRSMRSELNLTQYSLENLAFELLDERIPRFSFQALTQLWRNRQHPSNVKTVINYWMTRVRMNIRLLQKQDYIARIVEQARLTGIDFYSVYYRGSQYKVESILFRLCKQEDFLSLSPSRKQVKNQRALECVPLVMEPESAFYKSPVVVLDFQSLYPSIMIAYNLCYSTMVGRVRDLDFKNELGVTKFPFPKNAFNTLEEHTRITANGIVYVKSSYRNSTLARMLEDLLYTRRLVKKTMSDVGSKNSSLQKLLNRRQLALKLIANVTYGYTSASFSGRMPCSDLADTIVQTGREILEKAIEFIEANEKWGAKVIYGDTDSLFIYLPGKCRYEAHNIGEEMATEVTKRNRSPISLKFEKVYHPSILLSKKRYVGFMYELPSQLQPIFDAKGIETVRRDGHPAQQKIVKKCIQILFRTKDLSQVKKYVQEQFVKIHQSKVSLQDFCFARGVRLGSYKSEKTAPPGAVVATRQKEHDHRSRPQYKERVPYVVARGSVGQILRDRCISPEEFLTDETLELDSDYYIEKTLVPPLSRLFNIMGVNVAEWAFEVTRNQSSPAHREAKNIEKVILNLSCINCGNDTTTKSQLCEKCQMESLQTSGNLLERRNYREREIKTINTVCRICSYRYTQDAGEMGGQVASLCESHDCPVYFSRVKAAGYINSTVNRRIAEALNSINHW
ncbi:hypothetical protein ZYGR_0S02350 [Zygosaccharomyces rouxii]|uniref:DNA polymerase n=2 Tax=Zygosaccharomyces rouxii TaxID=4956 RepID=C5DXU0_ZYGRC|nr:uncharacterized protein ZYRO0F07766g [Zygosaccharomyces rouxii]KAH9199360.1 hypothetical protein LQ764DRAFT_235178 [Zygosaccharomyces rouxii]GAV50101.1 hypothetical protein ZYGR_0S02350 [Zygosaccharomyces rouxii]CAR28601.1 ZYRO0F07766p [Zygosaccharomyces rouxii]